MNGIFTLIDTQFHSLWSGYLLLMVTIQALEIENENENENGIISSNRK